MFYDSVGIKAAASYTYMVKKMSKTLLLGEMRPHPANRKIKITESKGWAKKWIRTQTPLETSNAPSTCLIHPLGCSWGAPCAGGPQRIWAVANNTSMQFVAPEVCTSKK